MTETEMHVFLSSEELEKILDHWEFDGTGSREDDLAILANLTVVDSVFGVHPITQTEQSNPKRMDVSSSSATKCYMFEFAKDLMEDDNNDEDAPIILRNIPVEEEYHGGNHDVMSDISDSVASVWSFDEDSLTLSDDGFECPTSVRMLPRVASTRSSFCTFSWSIRSSVEDLQLLQGASIMASLAMRS